MELATALNPDRGSFDNAGEQGILITYALESRNAESRRNLRTDANVQGCSGETR